jgi:hypothetical protein
MIPDYEDDVKMAEAGRRAVKWKAIKNSREIIRDIAVSIGGSDCVRVIRARKEEMNQAIDNLIEALEL